MTEPQASILIPIYNGERTLERCLQLWLAQDCEDYELMLVDNGSTDRSLTIAHDIQKKAQVESPGGPRVRLFSEKRPGQTAATNRAIREARGEMLVFSAADMIVDEAFLPGHLAAHRRHARPGEIVAVIGHIDYPQDYMNNPFMSCVVEKTLFQFGYQVIGDILNADPRCLYAPNFSISAGSMHSVGLLDESFPYGWQDTDLGFRIRKSGGRIVYEKGLQALHDHPLEWRSFSLRMEKMGVDCPRILDKHPEVGSRSELIREVHAHFLEAGRLVSAAMRIVLFTEANPGHELPAISVEGRDDIDSLQASYVILLKYHFYKGVYEGGRKLWGLDCWDAPM